MGKGEKGSENLSPPGISPRRREVWVWADAHIGKEIDGRDGGDWAERSLRDLLDNAGRPDYVLVLGDITHGYTREQFERYAAMRRASGVPRWFELVGNHDYHGTETGLYAELVRREQRYVLIDGNLAWVFVSAERGRAAGIVRASSRRWLEAALARHQDKNLILCTHQVPPRTVRRSDPVADFERVLGPADWVASLPERFRIDAWLFGHEHGPPRTRNQILRRGRTTFVNVASLSHIYRTAACNSFVLRMRAGGREIHALCRDHDREKFIAGLGVRIPLPFPLELSGQPQVVDVHETRV